MIGLLFEELFGDEDGKLNLVDLLLAPFSFQNLHNLAMHVISIHGEDWHALHGVAFVHDVRVDEDALIPRSKLAGLVNGKGLLV